MLCPNCQAECLESDEFCPRCGSEVSSKSLISTQGHGNLPAILQHPQLPRVAVGVGAVVFGLGLELLRRNIAGRLARTALRAAPKLLPSPAAGNLREAFIPQNVQPSRLPRGYEIEETAIYISRVIRRTR